MKITCSRVGTCTTIASFSSLKIDKKNDIIAVSGGEDMNRQIIAFISAFLVFAAAVWFPAPAVYAESPETDAAIVEEAEEVCSDADTPNGPLDEDEGEPEPGSETEPKIEPEDGTEAETEPVAEADPQTSDSSFSTNSPPLGYSLGRSGDVVYTWEGLDEWIDEHWESGGTVDFGCDITIPEGEFIYLYTWGKTLVRTGEFGLIVQGRLTICNGSFTGNGAPAPVIEVLPGGELYVKIDERSTDAITATGDGGRAISVREGAALRFALNAALTLCAEGENSVALESEIPLDLSYMFIKASGAGSVGIVCTEPVSLYLCKISGGDASVRALRVDLDTSIATPAPENAVSELNRKITRLSGAEYNLAVGGYVDFHSGAVARIFATLDADGAEEPDEVVLWARLKDFEIDFSVTGTYFIDLELTWPYSEFDLITEQCPLRLTLNLNDSTQKPFYADSSYNSRQRKYFLYYNYTGNMDKLTLWRSDDDGDIWYIYEDAELTYDGESIVIALTEDELINGVTLVFETEDYGDSDVRTFYLYNGKLSQKRGGDRTGGDRGQNTPPETDPGGNTPTDPPTDPGGGTPTDPPTDPGGGTPTDPPTDPGSSTPTDPPVTGGTTDRSSDGNSGGGSTQREGDRTNTTAVNITSAPAAAQTETPPPLTPVPAAVRPAEYSDAWRVTLSGERLAVMVENNPEYVPFLRGELRALLPAFYLKSLRLNPADVFTVTLYQPDESSFAVSFAVNGAELTDRFDETFLVSLPWDGGPVSCASNGGEAIDASLDGGRVEFALHYTGTYVLTERAIAAISIMRDFEAALTEDEITPGSDPFAAPQTQAKPWSDGWAPVTAVGFIGLAGAGAFFGFTRKKAVKRP